MKKLNITLITIAIIIFLFGVTWYSFYLHGISKENDTFSSGILSLTGNILTAIITAIFSYLIYKATVATNEATEATNRLTKQIHEENNKVVLKGKIEDNKIYPINIREFQINLSVYNLGNSNTYIESINVYSPFKNGEEYDLRDVKIYGIQMPSDTVIYDSVPSFILPARTVNTIIIYFCPYNYKENSDFTIEIHIKDILGNKDIVDFKYINFSVNKGRKL